MVKSCPGIYEMVHASHNNVGPGSDEVYHPTLAPSSINKYRSILVLNDKKYKITIHKKIEILSCVKE